jgi:DNA-binding GntR family transcriptional regulator
MPRSTRLAKPAPATRTAAKVVLEELIEALPEPMTEATATQQVVDALTKAIIEHRMLPGAKLPEQKLADRYGVSRTIIRQAIYQMITQGLIRMEPAKGAFVATPSLAEAKQVFATRRMLESGLARAFAAQATPAQIKKLQEHMAAEQAAVDEGDANSRVELLGDFHVQLALLMKNQVLAEVLQELISRCHLVTLIYQSAHAAQDSAVEHRDIVRAFAKRDQNLAARLMDEHLLHVEAGLKEPATTVNAI